MVDVDSSRWTKRNVWRRSSGELCVRPGLRRVYAPESGRAIVAVKVLDDANKKKAATA